MESSEDERGAARDAVEQPSTRENTEMLSGGGEPRSLVTCTGTDGEPSRSMDRGAHSSYAVDEDGCHNTETILNMIDEFIDEPKLTKSAKYSADSTVCGHTPPRETALSSGIAYNDRSTDNCVAVETAQGSVESTASVSHVKDKQLEDMVNDISSSSTNQGASGSGCSGSGTDIVDSNTMCDPIESCSKAESLPGQRRKLVRPALPREVTKSNTAKHQEGHSSLEDKQDTGGSNDTPTQSSPKKVKLVRHSNVKAKPLTVTHLPHATSLQVDSSSGPPPQHNQVQCYKQDSSSSDVITNPIDAHSSHESEDSGSDVKQVPSVNKLDSSEVKLTNSLNSVSEVCEDDKSNDVLDVRKVSPLRLSRSTIDESLNSNNKNSATKHNIEVQQNDIGNQSNLDECKNIPKLTLKLGSKYNEDVRGCNKVSKLNIKPVKPSDLPACSKSKHLDEHNESEHNVPNVIKLNIKPIHKPDDTEKDNKSSSSSSEISECESSENETISECIQSPTVETTECEQDGRSVPKLTIKSLSTVPKVDCESHKHKVGRRSQSPEPPVISKLHIKPIIPPPIEKMTIKLNKSHESESKCETESSHTESVPKMTIKLGKTQDDATVLENNFEDDKADCALKMKIKLGKSLENCVDVNSDSPSEHCPVTRSSKRLNQKHEHIAEQHVPKLTIKIPQEHETKSSEKSSNSPSVPKLTIKPIIKPEEIERSSSPTIPKLTIKPIPKPEEHDIKGDENVDQPSIPKLTIKPILKPDDHHVERCPSPTITKLNIKPVIKPDELESKLSDTTDSHGIPKLTIKAVKADDHDQRHNESGGSSIPRLTIKPVIKPDDIEVESQTVPKLTIKPVIKPDEQVSETEIHSVPKLTIKPVVKPDESISETDTQTIPKLTIKPVIKPGDVVSDVETVSIPKITIKPVVKYDENDLKHSQGPSSPSVPKLTIKPVSKHDDTKTDLSDVPSVRKLTIKNVHKAEEQELRRSERCASPNVPKFTIKPVEVPVVPKLTIKPILKPEEHPVQESSNTISKSISKSVIDSEDDGAVTKISIKPIPKCTDNEVVERVVEKSEEVTIRTRSKASLEETISKLNSKTKSVSETFIELNNDLVVVTTDPSSVKLSMQSVPEDLVKPLEITTSPTKNSPSHQESGLESPRIILKINKCAQGSVSEVLIDESQHKNDEPVVTAEITNNIESPKPPTEVTMPTKNIVNEPPVATQEDTAVTKKELVEEKPPNDLKSEELNEKIEETNETSKENDKKLVKPSYKRTRARESVLNKCPDKGSLALQTKRQKLVNAITNLHNKNKKNTCISVPLNSSKEESITSNTSVTCNSVNEISPNNGESNYNDIHSNKNSNDGDSESTNSFAKVNENSTIVEGDSNTTSTRGSDDTTSETNQHATDSPIFNKVDRNMLVLNDETNSQECMMIDELSQDPLDIESAAKSHFAPVTATTTPVMSIKDTIKIVQQTPMEIAESLGLSQQPKRRGRPRKNPLPEIQTPTPVKPPSEPKVYPKLPTPALEERPVRVLRTPRDRPAILRTPRTRGGRGRGGNRRGASNSNTRDVGTSPPESPVDKAIKFFDLSNSNIQTTITPCKVDMSRLVQEESGGEEEEEEIVKSVRGRGSGRMTRRGGRRSRGGARGKGSRGGLLKGGQRGEEIQLQDALPLASPLGRREGRKSRLEPTLTPALQVFEEETCMIGDNATPKRNISLVDEESQSSVLSGQTASESGTRTKRPKLMDMLDEGHKEWTPADVAEYDWPPEGTSCRGESSQTVMIQEQVALYLGVKSFKRRYPDLKRRALSADEKNYIRDRGLISEALCDLGVTAVDAGEVLDIMFTDYPDKYEEYRKHLRERREAKPAPTPSSKPTLAPPPAKQSVSRQEILEKACESAASWNAQLNKQRKVQRPTSMDLQTLTLHRPRKPTVIQEPNPNSISYYPVALLPGQFTDYYRHYTPEELRYFPLNTVMDLLPSPKPVVESSSEESDSNSDSENTSGAESDSETSTIETNSRRKAPIGKAKARQSVGNPSRPVSPTIDSTPIKTEGGIIKSEPTAASSTTASDVPNKCKVCEGSEFASKRNPNEAFITCATCQKKIHPSCLDMSQSVTKCVRGYAWQCADCKCCGQCGDLADDDKMLFCDLCDRGYHIYCVGLKKVPTGRWHCVHCAVCRSCGSRSPSGPQGVEPPGPDAPPDQWHHHFKRTNAGQRIYSHTLCAPCAKAWSLGLFCPSCEKCFVGRKGAMGLVICVRCDRRYHQECIRQVRKSLDVLNFMCSNCRRGVNPKHKLRRAERTPRKSLQSFADSSMHSIVTDSNSSMQNTSSNMDQGGDSSSAVDSMQPSPLQETNDSNSISDLPLNNLKVRQDEYESCQSNEVDFKTASRRLFSVDTSVGSNMPSNMSEYRIPNICSRVEEAKSAPASHARPDNKDASNSKALPQPRDPQVSQTPDDVEGGA